MKDGFDVRGFFYWTLIDNFEWNFAWVRMPLVMPARTSALPLSCSMMFLCAAYAGAEVWPVRVDP